MLEVVLNPQSLSSSLDPSNDSELKTWRKAGLVRHDDDATSVGWLLLANFAAGVDSTSLNFLLQSGRFEPATRRLFRMLGSAIKGPAPSTTKLHVDVLSERLDWRMRVYGPPALSIAQDEEFWKSKPALVHEQLDKDVIIIEDNDDPFQVLRKMPIYPEEIAKGALVIEALFSDKRIRRAFGSITRPVASFTASLSRDTARTA